jgi:hypothetical protein
MNEFTGLEIVQTDKVLGGEHAIGIGRLPGRKQVCLYLREDARITSVAFFHNDMGNDHANEVKRWLELIPEVKP